MSAHASPAETTRRALQRRLRLPAFRGFQLPATAAFMGVWFAVGLHLLWASLLLAGSEAPKHATALYALAELFPAKTGLAIILVTVAWCAMYGIVKHKLSVAA